jgi:hypothetical protein
MPAVKKYTRINFQNYPSTSTPLNATNLNKMDKGIDDLDDEVVAVKNTIENMSFDADAISYDNTQSGLQATDVQGAVDELNDNLSGFKFYPAGTGIVGLISDDSAYTDEDGNYVIWGTETAEQLVEDNPNTYKSVPSEEDTRGKVGKDTVVKFGGVNMNIVGSVELTLADTYPTYASDSIIVNDGKYKKLKVNLTSINGGGIFIKTLNADSTVKDTLTTNNSGTYEFDIHDAYSIYMRCYANQSSKRSKINYILE